MKSDPEAIVFLTPGFPKDEGETNCLPALQDFILTFQKEYPSFEIKVITFQYPNEKKRYTWNGIEIFSTGYRRNHFANHLISWLHVGHIFSAFKKKYSVRFICSFWLTECTLVGQWLSKLYNIPVYAWAMGQDALPSNQYLKFLRKKQVKVLAISEALSRQLHRSRGFYADQIIPLGVNEIKLAGSKPEARTIDIIGIGSLIPLKNFSLFLDIIDEVRKSLPQLQCAIIGEGTERPALERKNQSLHLQNQVQLVGSISHEEVFTWLKKSKILLHTSSYEGQGLVMTEALACGCYVVCGDIGRLQSPRKMFVCRNKEEMIVQLKSLLRTDFDFDSLVMQTMRNTIHQFGDFCGLKSS